jgi:hypothetical protein
MSSAAQRCVAADEAGASDGASPILIDRVNFELHVLGTAKSVQAYLMDYETRLPPARLSMKPEFPPRAG